jgi:hypothetical protein
MSTKTTFKRVALVAVASLGFGMLSVAPSFAATAAYTTVLGTVTPTVPTVGAAVTVPLKLTLAADTENAAGAPTFTATFAQKPVNTSLADTNLVANVTGSELATAGAALAVATAATNVITVTTPATDITAFTAALAENYVFTPDQPGMYSVTITASAGTFTATTAVVINVGGAALTQSSSGKGAAIGNAIVNGSAVAAFTVRSGTAAATRFNVTSTGVGSVNNGLGCVDQCAVLVSAATAVRCSGTAVGTVATINGTNYAAGFSYTSGAAITNGALTGASKSEQFTFDASSSEIGTQTVTVTEIALATGIPTVRATVVINWVASTSSNASAQYSTVFMNAGTTLAASTNDDTVAGVACSRTAGTQCANILVSVKDTNNVALNQASISATITGPGLMGFAADGTTATTGASGRVVATSATVVLTANSGVISVYPDGTSGAATITISSGTVVLATKTINFYGTVATLTATQNLKVARASAAGAELGTSSASATWLTTAATPAVYIVAKDSSGVIVPGLTITALSNSPAVIVSGAVTQDDATAGDGPGYYNASVTSAPGGTSGASGTVVFRTLLSTGAYVSTDAITFTLGGSLATMTLTLDKATYAPGESMIVTRTAKDSAGNPVYDGVASPAVVFSKANGGTAPAAGAFASGVSATSTSRPTVFAPSVTGEFEARASYTNATTLATTQITAKATVSDDAAAEATDAANAATDAANAAAEAADAADAATAAAQDAAGAVAALSTAVSAMVSDLKKQITALTNLVIKIQKKVKA